MSVMAQRNSKPPTSPPHTGSRLTDLFAADGLLKDAEAVANRRIAWQQRNIKAIASYNKFVTEKGIYSDGSKQF